MSRRLDAIAPPVAIVLIVFAAIPFALIAGHGSVLTGATGVFPADQLQYLAWIRDLSTHLLARNSFDFGPSKRVFTDPFFALSGGLVRLGLSPALAYLAWLPVAAAALVAGFSAYVRRLLPSSRERLAALVLALFAVSPAAPLLGWIANQSQPDHNQLALAVADSTPALQLWGYFPIAITLALVCATFLAVERCLDAGKQSRRPLRVELAIAGGCAVFAGWLHPWQGVTIVVVLAALAALDRSRRAIFTCGAVALAACLPLGYYYVLPHIDDAWKAAQAQNNLSFVAWVAPVVLLPLGLPAILGVSRGRLDVQERILLIWPLAALAVYVLDPPYSIHALETASLPLAILAVRGANRLRLGPAAAVPLVALATVPGLAFAVDLLNQAIDQRPAAYALKGDDARALDVVARSRVPGGVLAPDPIAPVVPGRTGRRVWLGHPTWTPGLGLREHEADRFFGGRMRAHVARRFVHNTGARLAVAPCGSSPSLERLLGPSVLASTVRVGCARVLTFKV